MAPLRTADRGPGWSYRPPPDDGLHQPGVATARPDHLALAAYDVDVGSADELRGLLAAWARTDVPGATITVGLGPALFARDRLGLGRARPVHLHELPPFPGDALDPAFCGGDVVVQAGAGTAEAARTALPAGVSPRWLQTGFLRRGPRDKPGATPRDPLGFRDGSMNVRRGRDRDRHVWIDRGDRAWMAGGTYMVVRRIQIDLERWRALRVDEQEQVVGRHKASGAPLGRRWEFDPIVHDDLPPGSHVFQAAPRTNGGAMLLRRGYAYERGLVFIAFARDPVRQYVPMQRRLAEHDALSAYTRHVGSAIFAIPPAAWATR